jgi:hypothetical protein
MKKKVFTLDEVKKLVINAYEVGYCDGEYRTQNEFKDYRNAHDFWNRNMKAWVENKINYVL